MKKILCGAIALALTTSGYAASVSGSTNFKVTVPEILVLYHWDEAHLTLTATPSTPANDSDANEISDAAAHDLSAALGASSYNISGDVSTATSATNQLNEIDVTLKNSWAIRAISAGDVKLSLAEQNDSYTLKNTVDDTKTITITNAVLSSADAKADNNTAEITFAPKWAVQKGDIKFKMDLSNVTYAGDYTSNGAAAPASEADDTFLLTLTGN